MTLDPQLDRVCADAITDLMLSDALARGHGRREVLLRLLNVAQEAEDEIVVSEVDWSVVDRLEHYLTRLERLSDAIPRARGKSSRLAASTRCWAKDVPQLIRLGQRAGGSA